MLISISKQTVLFFLRSTPVLQGALVGLLAGFTISLWVGIGAQLYPPLPERTMPLSLETYGCNSTYNGTDWMTTTEVPFSTSAFQVYNIERYWIELYTVVFFKMSVTGREPQLLFLPSVLWFCLILKWGEPMWLSGYDILFRNSKKCHVFLVSIETSTSPTDAEETWIVTKKILLWVNANKYWLQLNEKMPLYTEKPLKWKVKC